MSYTPTTEEVRDVYQRRLIKVSDNRFELIDEAQADAEFDRWLAEVKAQERAAERERCTEIMDLKSGHYARTHYAGKVCYTCDIFAAIYEGS